jgi:hypothetical protein
MEDVKTTLRLPGDLKELLTAKAKEEHRSVHNLILSILWSYFGK